MCLFVCVTLPTTYFTIFFKYSVLQVSQSILCPISDMFDACSLSVFVFWKSLRLLAISSCICERTCICCVNICAVQAHTWICVDVRMCGYVFVRWTCVCVFVCKNLSFGHLFLHSIRQSRVQ